MTPLVPPAGARDFPERPGQPSPRTARRLRGSPSGPSTPESFFSRHPPDTGRKSVSRSAHYRPPTAKGAARALPPPSLPHGHPCCSPPASPGPGKNTRRLSVSRPAKDAHKYRNIQILHGRRGTAADSSAGGGVPPNASGSDRPSGTVPARPEGGADRAPGGRGSARIEGRRVAGAKLLRDRGDPRQGNVSLPGSVPEYVGAVSVLRCRPYSWAGSGGPPVSTGSHESCDACRSSSSSC